MRILLVTMYFPPAGGGGVQRPLKFATHLPALGFETHVLAPDDPKWLHADPELAPPSQAWIHRARYVGPRARKLAEDFRIRAIVVIESAKRRFRICKLARFALSPRVLERERTAVRPFGPRKRSLV